MADTGIFAWLDRASRCGDVDVERSADMLKNYYQGVGPESEYNEQTLASRPAEVDDEGLPALPNKRGTIYQGNYWTDWDEADPPGVPLADVYTAEQYRQGQRDAVAADRARRAAAGGGQ